MAVTRGRRAASGFLGEFLDFINRGNVVDLAVAVVIGGAFGKIIDSLVTDIITPAIVGPALAAAGVDRLEDWVVGDGIKLGLFLAAILNFLIIAFSIFVVIRLYEGFKRRMIRTEAVEAPPDAAGVAQERLTTAIERLTDVVERKTM
jgi:large conductance mechanosensitive channel